MHQQKRFGYSNTTMLPVYNSAEETITHMLQCQILTNPEWKRDFQTALKDAGVERRVRALMSYRIRAWLEGEETNTEDHTELEKNIFYNQGKIIWSHLLRGTNHRGLVNGDISERIKNGLQADP